MDAPDGLALTCRLGATERGELWRAGRHQPDDRILRVVDAHLCDQRFRDATATLRRREHPRLLRVADAGWAGGRYYLEYAIAAEWRSLEEHLDALEHWHDRLPVVVGICEILPTWQECPIRPLGLDPRSVIM